MDCVLSGTSSADHLCADLQRRRPRYTATLARLEQLFGRWTASRARCAENLTFIGRLIESFQDGIAMLPFHRHTQQ
jgi:hypothetical protein